MRRRSRLGISTWVYFWKPLEDVLRKIADTGYSTIEIFANNCHLDPRIFPDISALKNLLNGLHLKVHSLHAPFSDLDIASLDEEERTNSIEFIKKSMEFCSEIEGKIVIIHPCSTKMSGNDQNDLSAINKVQDSLRTLTTFAEKLRIKLAVENLPNIGGWSFGIEMAELKIGRAHV